jgi:hypothetical protein
MKKIQKFKGKRANKATNSGFIRLTDLKNKKSPNFVGNNKNQVPKSNLIFRQKSVRHR